jgi:hypothetical protein
VDKVFSAVEAMPANSARRRPKAVEAASQSLKKMCERRNHMELVRIQQDCSSVLRADPETRGGRKGKEMSYQVRYDYGLKAPSPHQRKGGFAAIEEFQTEQAALGRARELLDDGDHYAVSVRDEHGDVLCGVRLQLKLGWFPA